MAAAGGVVGWAWPWGDRGMEGGNVCEPVVDRAMLIRKAGACVSPMWIGLWCGVADGGHS